MNDTESLASFLSTLSVKSNFLDHKSNLNGSFGKDSFWRLKMANFVLSGSNFGPCVSNGPEKIYNKINMVLKHF